jgi:hypothetical protein
MMLHIVICNLKVYNYLTLGNIIPVKPWCGDDESDDSLLKLKNIVQSNLHSGNYDIYNIVRSSINNDV